MRSSCYCLPLRASALLSLLIQVPSLHGYSSNANRQQPFPTVEAKAKANDKSKEDAFTGLFSLMTIPSKQRRRKQQTSNSQQPPPQRPPLVDSDLLRFLSLQKQNLLQQRPSNLSNSNVSFIFDPPSPQETAVSREEAVSGIQLEITLPTSTVDSSSSLANDTSSPSPQFWLTQYNSHRVTQVLLSKDATLDESLASLAGERVQAQVLSRTARRRVRQFLKERDRIWGGMKRKPQQQQIPQQQQQQQPLQQAQTASQGEVLLAQQQSTSTQGAEVVASAASSTPNLFVSYGFKDTVDLMLDSRYGLTVRDIAEILIHTPSIALMQPRPLSSQSASSSTEGVAANAKIGAVATSRGGETLQETLDRSLVRLLCGTLRLRKYDARKVLRSCPGLLTKRGSRSAELTVNMLSKLNVSTNSLARDKAALPTLLSRSPALIFRLVSFLSSDAVRMPVSQIGPLLRRPQSLELLDAVAPVVPLVSKSSASFLSTSRTASRDKEDDKSSTSLEDKTSVLMALDFDDGEDADDDHPGIMSALWGRSSQDRRDRINQVYRNMTATAWTLRHEVGTTNLGKVVAAYPTVLLLNAQDQILPVAKYLMEDLGIWKDDLARVLQLYPVLLGMSVSQMEKVVTYLADDFDIDSDNLGIIFRSFPHLLTLSVEQDMEPVINFLQSQIGIANVGRFICRLPPVLGYSVERDLEPKWKFLETVFVDARFEVTRFPAYFSYPLERVIKTRFEYLRNVKRIPTPLVALDQVLRYGDKDFATKVAKDTDNGAAFAAFVKRRQSKPFDSSEA